MIKVQNKNNKNIANATNKKSGFTLVEIIVSLAIFTIVAVVAVGAFIRILDANKKAQALQTATNNLNFALESMTREMRVGTLYKIASNSGNFTTISKGDVTNLRQVITETSSDGSFFYIAFRSSAVSTLGSGAPCNLINIYRFTKVGNGPSDPNNNILVSKREQKECGESIDVNGSTGFTEVLSPNLKLTRVDILVNGEGSGNSYNQPYARIRMSGYAGPSEETRSYFDLQTSVTQRESINNF